MDEITPREAAHPLAASFQAALLRARARRERQAVLRRPRSLEETDSGGVEWIDRLAEPSDGEAEADVERS